MVLIFNKYSDRSDGSVNSLTFKERSSNQGTAGMRFIEKNSKPVLYTFLKLIITSATSTFFLILFGQRSKMYQRFSRNKKNICYTFILLICCIDILIISWVGSGATFFGLMMFHRDSRATVSFTLDLSNNKYMKPQIKPL